MNKKMIKPSVKQNCFTLGFMSLHDRKSCFSHYPLAKIAMQSKLSA